MEDAGLRIDAWLNDEGPCPVNAREAKEEIRRLRAASQWISVEDRLPSKPIVMARDKFGFCCQMGFVAGEFRSLLTRVPPTQYQSQITHWMPIPEPPKVK